MRNKEFRKCWQKTSTMLQTKSKVPLSVNNIKGDENIANEIRDFFSLSEDQGDTTKPSIVTCPHAAMTWS